MYSHIAVAINSIKKALEPQLQKTIMEQIQNHSSQSNSSVRTRSGRAVNVVSSVMGRVTSNSTPSRGSRRTKVNMAFHNEQPRQSCTQSNQFRQCNNVSQQQEQSHVNSISVRNNISLTARTQDENFEQPTIDLHVEDIDLNVRLNNNVNARRNNHRNSRTHSLYISNANNRNRNNSTERSRHKRNNWTLHYRRNETLVKARFHYKKVYRKISAKIRAGETEATLGNRSQQPLRQSDHPLDVEGVIYAIVQNSDNSIYVGQTINSAYSRLKSHWHGRNQDDFRNKGLHSRMRKANSIDNFTIWPLEFIDPSVYIVNDIIHKDKFRQFASLRENYWIHQLKTLQPRGLNLCLPSMTKPNRRFPDAQPESNFIRLHNDELHIDHTSHGPTQHIRTNVSRLIRVYRTTPEILNTELKKLSKRFRLQILHWSYSHIPTALVNEALTAIQSNIRELNVSQPQNKLNKDVIPDYIKVVHIHEAICYANLRAALRDSSISALLPGNNGTRTDKVPMVCDKQVVPASTLLCNFSVTAKDISESSQYMPPPENCPCHMVLRPHCTDLVNGHVMSTNFNFIANEELKRQFYYGSVFKENQSSASILEAISLGLEDYVTRTIAKLKDKLSQGNISDLNKWKTSVLQRCSNNLNLHRLNINRSFKRNGDAASYLRKLKQHFVISPVDKLTHNLAFTCKLYYKHMLYKEIHSTAYSPSTISFDQIMRNHKTFNLKYAYKHKAILPYLYAIPKLHKSPPTFRFIAGVSNPVPRDENTTQLERIFSRPPYEASCSTTPASKKLCEYLQSVMHILRLKDNEFYKVCGFRRCWFVTNIDDVFREIKQNIPTLKGLKPRTFDFATMYTKIPHEKIFNNIKAVINEAIIYRRLITSSSIPLLPDPDIIMDHLRFVVSNTFLCNNPTEIKQQTIGIPMGTNAAPEIANLTLYCDEAQFIDSLINNGFLHAARTHAYTRRYIDDLLLWNTLPPPPELYGLDYSETSELDGSVTFLGAKISTLGNGFIDMSVFDKTASWKNFPVIRYTHGDSNVPTHQSSGIVLSQLMRYRLICSSIKAFKVATSSLIRKLLEREHSCHCILKGWNAYLTRYKNDRITNIRKLRLWFRRMLKWASHNTVNLLDPFPTTETEEIHYPATAGQQQHPVHDNPLQENHNPFIPPLPPPSPIPPPPPPLTPPLSPDILPPIQLSPTLSQSDENSIRSNNSYREAPTAQPDQTPNILFLLTRYGSDNVFDSVRTYIDSALQNIRRKRRNSLMQVTSCEICSQAFNQLGRHQRHQNSLFGCFNIARLRSLICSKKNIPFGIHPSITEQSIEDLEDYLQQLITR